MIILLAFLALAYWISQKGQVRLKQTILTCAIVMVLIMLLRPNNTKEPFEDDIHEAIRKGQADELVNEITKQAIEEIRKKGKDEGLSTAQIDELVDNYKKEQDKIAGDLAKAEGLVREQRFLQLTAKDMDQESRNMEQDLEAAILEAQEEAEEEMLAGYPVDMDAIENANHYAMRRLCADGGYGYDGVSCTYGTKEACEGENPGIKMTKQDLDGLTPQQMEQLPGGEFTVRKGVFVDDKCIVQEPNYKKWCQSMKFSYEPGVDGLGKCQTTEEYCDKRGMRWTGKDCYQITEDSTELQKIRAGLLPRKPVTDDAINNAADYATMMLCTSAGYGFEDGRCVHIKKETCLRDHPGEYSEADQKRIEANAKKNEVLNCPQQKGEMDLVKYRQGEWIDNTCIAPDMSFKKWCEDEGLTYKPARSGVGYCQTNKEYCEKKMVGWDKKGDGGKGNCKQNPAQWVSDQIFGTTVTRGMKGVVEGSAFGCKYPCAKDEYCDGYNICRKKKKAGDTCVAGQHKQCFCSSKCILTSRATGRCSAGVDGKNVPGYGNGPSNKHYMALGKPGCSPAFPCPPGYYCPVGNGPCKRAKKPGSYCLAGQDSWCQHVEINDKCKTGQEKECVSGPCKTGTEPGCKKGKCSWTSKCMVKSGDKWYLPLDSQGCGVGANCVPGTWCGGIPIKCNRRGSVGAYCPLKNSACKEGLYCDSASKCAKKKGKGAGCFKDSACKCCRPKKGGKCDGHKCVKPPCVVNKCVEFKCCGKETVLTDIYDAGKKATKAVSKTAKKADKAVKKTAKKTKKAFKKIKKF